MQGKYEGTDDPEIIKRMQYLSGISYKLNMFIDAVDKTWMCDIQEYEGRKSISFKPIWIPRKLADKYIWGHAKRFNLMSATFPPVIVLAKTLGLDVNDIDYREFPSTFPAENRPVVLDPVVNMTYSTMDSQFPVLREKVKELLERHKDEKGIVHCVSYKIVREIMKIDNKRLVTHEGSNKIEELRKFKESKEPLVFVSPSSERGVSLDDDMCRWVVFAKAPFLSLADKTVAARVYGSSVGNLWYRGDMIQTVVQGCGRAVRNKDDYAVSYILDAQITKVMSENPTMMPGWFRAAIGV
jgi:Rad3-related DNA helicase